MIITTPLPDRRDNDEHSLYTQTCAYRLKRVLFLASLYFNLKGTTSPCDEQLQLANKELQLVYRASALAFPAALSAWIWRKLDGGKILEEYIQDNEKLPLLINHIWTTAPAWCRYDKLSVVVEEVKHVFETLRFA